MEILEIILRSANKFFILNKIVCVRYPWLESINNVNVNESFRIKLCVSNSNTWKKISMLKKIYICKYNTWNHFIMCKQMIDIK